MSAKKAVKRARGMGRRSRGGYDVVRDDVVVLLESARRTAARAVNAVMTATYWEVGRRIVEFEQGGEARAEYGEQVIARLSRDLTKRFGKGFGRENLRAMRLFFRLYPAIENSQTASGESRRELPAIGGRGISQTPSGKSPLATISARFPLPWSHYVRLLSVEDESARRFYEREALRGGWSVRQLDRQVSTAFYERTVMSRNKVAMLRKGERPRGGESLSAAEEIKDPFVLEFLNLKDEYSESDLEQALVRELETFLMELGGDFCFVGRQRRLRIDDEWYRIDLLFYHRVLRCLVVIDIKLGRFTHADAGQMNLYLNYIAEHWTHEDEQSPIGIILCAHKGEAVARYALAGMSNRVMAAEYRMVLPSTAKLEAAMERAQRRLGARASVRR